MPALLRARERDRVAQPGEQRGMGMSASLLVAIPLALFAIVLLLCFVGCDVVVSADRVPPAFARYSEIILNESTLVAYWPLGESAGETTAVDLEAGRNGAYLSQVLPDDPSFPSAATPDPPVLKLGEQGIVPGDTVPPHDNSSAQTTCIEVNGGYVSVPFDAELNPTKADGLTIEAWVKVGWSAADTAATRIIIASSDTVGALRGYALLVSPLNIWEGAVGTGSGITFTTGPDVMFGTTNHLVLTYDGALLRLFVNGTQKTAIATDYQPSMQSRLFIGAGGTELPEPRGPWVGKIQCVAIYKGALSPEQVAKHTAFGNAMDVS
jgi:Concanavalin A-like lectin/glucanases superfamily